MSLGYFEIDSNQGSFLNSQRSNSISNIEQLYSLPSGNFPKFYEIVPAVVKLVDYSKSDGRIVALVTKGDAKEKNVEAYPLNVNIKKLPSIEDVVLLLEYKIDNIEELDSSSTNTRHYYIDILNTKFKPEFSNDLYPLPGDIIFQGQSGQSIRFTSSIRKNTIGFNKNPFISKESRKSTWVYGDDGGQPLIIISNGKNFRTNSNFNIEDINSDNSSIYLTSDSNIPLGISQTPSLFLNKNYPEIKFDGKQILSVSDSLTFKSRKNTNFYTDGYFSVNSNEAIVLTSKKDIVLETADNILLGKASNFLDREPVAKATSLINLLQRLINSLDNDFVHKGVKATLDLSDCRRELKNIASNYTYTL